MEFFWASLKYCPSLLLDSPNRLLFPLRIILFSTIPSFLQRCKENPRTKGLTTKMAAFRKE
jgi:hypothetical protein